MAIITEALKSFGTVLFFQIFKMNWCWIYMYSAEFPSAPQDFFIALMAPLISSIVGSLFRDPLIGGLGRQCTVFFSKVINTH